MEVIDTNLNGLFLMTQAALAVMKRGSTIVNNLSIAAERVFPGSAGYNASKHGALGFTDTLREELRPKGIRVIAHARRNRYCNLGGDVAPGPQAQDDDRRHGRPYSSRRTAPARKRNRRENRADAVRWHSVAASECDRYSYERKERLAY
jgi:NAD(P)-dependent dehydrogenase (short-subunit alcohol dehydrogenase family)